MNSFMLDQLTDSPPVHCQSLFYNVRRLNEVHWKINRVHCIKFIIHFDEITFNFIDFEILFFKIREFTQSITGVVTICCLHPKTSGA